MKPIYKVLLVTTPIVVTIVSVGVYFILSTTTPQKQHTLTTTIKHDSQNDHKGFPIKIFPELDQSNYYKYLRVEDGKAFITEELIAHVANDVLKNMQFVDGFVEWGWKYKNDLIKNDALISFVLKPTSHSILNSDQKKDYHFVIRKDT